MKTQVIERAGKKEFAVIPYRDFLRMQDELEDYRDLQMLRSAKADPANRKGRLFEEAAREMGLLPQPKRRDKRTNAAASTIRV